MAKKAKPINGVKSVPEIVMMETARLVRYERNARVHSPEQIDLVARSIKEFGFLNPIIVDASGTIVAGHCRTAAASKLGLDQVPTILVDHLTAEQVAAFRLMDNASAERSTWNIELLSIDMQELQLAGYDLSLTGFAPQMLDVFGLDGQAADPAALWAGMPEYVNGDKTAFRSLVVHFKDQQALDEFTELVGQKITPKTRFLWFPEVEIETYADKVYASEP
jgi:hypothetical protein